MGCGRSIPVKDVVKPVVPSPKDPVRLGRPQPQVDNIKNFVVVWLDATIGSNTDTQKSKDQQQRLINVVKIFTDPDECRAYINSVKDEKIFFIVSSALGVQFVSTVQDLLQLHSIYNKILLVLTSSAHPMDSLTLF